MNTQSPAAKSANKITVSIFDGSQVEVLQRKLAFSQSEFASLLTCFGDKDNECRRLRKKVRSLEKLIAELAPKA